MSTPTRCLYPTGHKRPLALVMIWIALPLVYFSRFNLLVPTFQYLEWLEFAKINKPFAFLAFTMI